MRKPPKPPESGCETRFCAVCGSPRHWTVARCAECHEAAFSAVPNVQYQGWLERQQEKLNKAKLVQPTLFEAHP